MNKWVGVIGFAVNEETAPGVWEDTITEKKLTGDIIDVRVRRSDSQDINTNVNVSAKISVVINPYLRDHLDKLRYLSYFGSYWKISDISVEFPRLVISLGGVYNGPRPN